MVEKLLFREKSLFELNKDEKAKYRSKDYFFILQSLTTKNCFEKPEIHQMFKIRAVDRNLVSKTGGNPPYLHVVNSHKVVNVMKFGNRVLRTKLEGCRFSCWSIECARRCSDDLNLEYSKG